MESKDIMELVDRIVLLTEENAQMRERIGRLSEAVKSAEYEDALNKERNKDKEWVRFDFTASIPADTINAIMGWKRDCKAVNIIEELKKDKT